MIRRRIATGLMLATCLLTTGITPLGLAIDADRASEISLAPSSTSLALKVDEPTEDSLLETALNVPAVDLAKGYLNVHQLFNFLPLAERGITIHTPGMTISTDNVERVKADLSLRLATYETAINSRGYESIARSYQATATPSCTQIQSLWAGSIANGTAGEISIVQENFEFQLVHSFDEEKPFTVEIPGIIVESTLMFDDPSNSDFAFVGMVTPEQITVRPDTDAILAAWPDWVKAPRRKDLKTCVVTLSPSE